MAPGGHMMDAGKQGQKSDMIFSLRFNGNKLSVIPFSLFFLHHNLNNVLCVEVRSGLAALFQGEFPRCLVFQSHNGE